MKKKLKISGISLLGFFGTAALLYFLGPVPTAPTLAKLNYNLPSNLELLDQQIKQEESQVPGIRKGSEARIIWADSSKSKTKVVFLYLHGFGASHKEGDPVHQSLASRYGANLYLTRLPGHGIDLGDKTMSELEANDFVKAAEHALSVVKKLGDEVVILSNSFGGALSLWLASEHREIKALVLYSPCVKVYDENAEIFVKPWGVQLASIFSGSPVFEYEPISEEHGKYWTTKYHLNGLAAFQSFLQPTMKESTFQKVKCPVFMGYWYKDEEVHDKVASIPAMLEMFKNLGSEVKYKVAFPNAGHHELTTPVFSNDVNIVIEETNKFLDKIL